jgi:hypothetical protein
VSIGGEEIPLTPIQTSANYVLYAGEVSQFSGAANEVRISVAGGESKVLFDSIAFSPEAIPEPNAVFLAVVGILLLLCKMRLRKTLS